MNSRELKEAIAAMYGVKPNKGLHATINRAVRKLPGGNELLDAIESANAARNHAANHHANERVIAMDAAIDLLESIRSAMEDHIIDEAKRAGSNQRSR